MRIFSFVILTVFLTFACKQTPPEIIDGKMYFGENIDSENTLSLNELFNELQEKEEVEDVKFKATVLSVCQTKGCWMNVADEGEEGESIFVRFKDYGFFMPKDIAGKQVIMQGKAFKEVTSVEDLKHFAEDAGKSEEEIAQIDEPKEELKFTASGVIVIQ